MAETRPSPLTPGGGRDTARNLSEVLRALRRRRGLRATQVARRMGMPLRTYEHFEAGRGRLNLERLTAFAEATNSDPFAILASLALDSPAFAVNCADNKLMLILHMAVQDLDAAVGGDIARLEPRTLVAAFDRCFGELRDAARRRDAFLEDWLAGRTARPTAGPGSEPYGVPEDDDAS